MSRHMHRAMKVSGLSGPQKNVLIHLAWYADMYDTVRPSLATLSELTGLSEQTVRRATRTLSERNLIRVNPSNGKVSNTYELWPNPVTESLNYSDTTDSEEVELRSSRNPSGSGAAAPWDKITLEPKRKGKRVRPGQIEETPDPEDVPPVRQIKLKRPEDYGPADLGRQFVEGLSKTPRAGEVGYRTAGGMMKRLLQKGASPGDVSAAVTAWFEDDAAMKELKTSTAGAWPLFSAFYSKHKSRKRRDAAVTGNDESSWEGYL